MGILPSHSIRLRSGGYWNFLDVWDSKFEIEDIAHNLSRESRYNGSTDGDWGYSVAQHEVNASYIVAPGFEYEALHHDDGEFAYKDLTTWLKSLAPDYKARLKEGEDRLADYFRIPRGDIPEVKLADLQMLKLEKQSPILFPEFDKDDESGFHILSEIDAEGLECLVDLEPWTPTYAKQRWLERHEELFNRRFI